MDDKKILDFMLKNPNLNDKTKKTYQIRLAEIKKFMNNETLDYIIHNPIEYWEKMNIHCDSRPGRLGSSKIGISKRDGLTKAIYSLFNNNPDLKDKEETLFKKWQEISLNTQNIIQNQQDSNEASERQKKAYVSLEFIKDQRDKLPHGTQDRLLLSMYTMIPPVRNNYWHMRIYNSKEEYDKEWTSKIKNDKLEKEQGEENFLLLKENIIYLQTYKTRKKYGIIEINIPEELKAEILISLEKKPRKYLFTNFRNKEFITSDAFSKFSAIVLRSYLGNKDISLTTIRHIYLIDAENKLKDMTVNERKEISNTMAHSLETQLRYLWHNLGNELVMIDEL